VRSAALTTNVRPVSRLFKALADERRIRIVALLAHGELCVCHVEAALGLTQPNASRQLGILRSAGVVEDRRKGSWVYYRLARQDESRHVAFGRAHLEHQAALDPASRDRLRAAVERRHDALLDSVGLNQQVFDALAVLAAGAWSRELARSAGLELPLRIRVLQALRSTPASPGMLRPVVSAVGRAISIKQQAGGALVLGGGWLGNATPDGRSYTLREKSRQGNWATACELFPPLLKLRCVEAWGGLQAQSLDDLPYIGGVSGLEGLTFAFASWYGFPIYQPRTFITSGYQGTLGSGFPTALGAKVAPPDRPVVAITGYGGFMFGVQELSTAVQFNIGVVTLVFNNNSYGNVRRDQIQSFDGRVVVSDLVNPDFVKLAESFGVGATRVTSPETFRSALEKALADGGPYLIAVEVPKDSETSPWEFIHPAKP